MNLDSFVQNMAALAKGRYLTGATIATIRKNRELMENARILQFITHAVDTKEGPSLVFDRLLNKNELPNDLRLKADVVLLAACGSVGTKSTKIGEPFSSLPRLFLASGAQNVIATRWNVRQYDAKEFSTRFLSEYHSTGNVEQAYSKAVNAFRKLHPNEPSRWAAWMLLGN